MHQPADDQRVDRHPDRPAPVRVAAEHARVGFRRQIADAVFLTIRREDIGVVTGQCPDPVGAQELVLVEHAGQDPAQPILVYKTDDAAFRHTQVAGPSCMDRFAEHRHAPQLLLKPSR